MADTMSSGAAHQLLVVVVKPEGYLVYSNVLPPLPEMLDFEIAHGLSASALPFQQHPSEH